MSLKDILPLNPKLYDKHRAPKFLGQPTIVYFHVTVLSIDSINEESMVISHGSCFRLINTQGGACTLLPRGQGEWGRVERVKRVDNRHGWLRRFAPFESVWNLPKSFSFFFFQLCMQIGATRRVLFKTSRFGRM